jgi:hypothetical protein
MNLALQCQCGALRGQLTHTQRALRGVCYCKDCRAYSNHLGIASTTHDSLGGADFVATQAKYVSLTDGLDNLACLSLSSKGLLRWYAKCCNMPIGNTTRNWKMSYVGVVRTCLQADAAAFERAFPRVQMRVNTASAKGAPPSMGLKTTLALAGFIPRVMASGINGSYQQTPFFSTPTGLPAVPITVLSKAERAHAYSLA